MTLIFQDSVVEILTLIKLEPCEESLNINELILSMNQVVIGAKVLSDWSANNLVLSNLLSDRLISCCVTVFELSLCIFCKLHDEIKRCLNRLCALL